MSFGNDEASNLDDENPRAHDEELGQAEDFMSAFGNNYPGMADDLSSLNAGHGPGHQPKSGRETPLTKDSKRGLSVARRLDRPEAAIETGNAQAEADSTQAEVISWPEFAVSGLVFAKLSTFLAFFGSSAYWLWQDGVEQGSQKFAADDAKALFYTLLGNFSALSLAEFKVVYDKSKRQGCNSNQLVSAGFASASLMAATAVAGSLSQILSDDQTHIFFQGVLGLELLLKTTDLLISKFDSKKLLPETGFVALNLGFAAFAFSPEEFGDLGPEVGALVAVAGVLMLGASYVTENGKPTLRKIQDACSGPSEGDSNDGNSASSWLLCGSRDESFDTSDIENANPEDHSNNNRCSSWFSWLFCCGSRRRGSLSHHDGEVSSLNPAHATSYDTFSYT